MKKILCSALLLAIAGCGETEEAAPKSDDPCAQLAENEAFDCITDAFWVALQEGDEADRIETYNRLGDILDTFDPPVDPKRHAHIGFHRGQLAMAIALENKVMSYISKVLPDMQRAMDMDPENPLYPIWFDSMDVGMAGAFEDYDYLAQIKDRVFENALKQPEGNIPSISGTTIGLPLNTGYPQMTLELFEEYYECVDKAWCLPVNDHAPYAMPGMNYHWAEQYMRVGNKERALYYLNQAASAEAFDKWPFRYMVDDALADIDAAIKPWNDLGEDGSGIYMSYANQDFGCMFCHTKETL